MRTNKQCPGHTDGRHIEDFDGSCMGKDCDFRFRPAALASAPPAAEPVRVMPEDFLSHQLSWRKAIATLAEQDDSGYWPHELRAFDRAYAELAAAPQPAEPAQPATQAGAGELKTTQSMEMAILMNRNACRLYPENIDARVAFGRGWKEALAAMKPAQPVEQPSQDANPPR